MEKTRRGRLGAALGLVAAAGLLMSASATPAFADGNGQNGQREAQHGQHGAATPIQHVVVIFQENVSFDHYFGTYPNAANTDGTKFTAQPGTPQVNGVTPDLLNHNPNLYNPQRLTPAQALTCDQNHGYSAEQKALDGGKMDKFVQSTETSKCTGQPILFGQPGLVMDYYDGNTVTGMWNYAQHYAMSDNSWDTTFGPSTPGALNLVSGQTAGGTALDSRTGTPKPTSTAVVSPDSNGVGTVIGDPDPAFDDCSDNNHVSTNDLVAMQGRNVGDLLNTRGVTWGWFQGGFRPTATVNGYSVCGSTHANIGGNASVDYSPHHNPFAYYKSTSNPKHLAPSSPSMIGKTDQANHQYDLTDFNTALKGNSLPAVSFLKAAEYQDGHPGYSDPLDEQTFLASTINAVQKSPEWKSTAVVVAYDDSDGWYDHAAPAITNGSADPANDQPICNAVPALGGVQDRCGPSQRLPLLVVSPWSKTNSVDHTLTNQVSVLRSIEDNWHLGRIGGSSFDVKANSLAGMFNFEQHPNTDPVLLDPRSGAVTSG